MKVSIRSSATLLAITLAACMGGGDEGAGGAGVNAAGTGGVSGGSGGTSGHTITAGEGGTSGIATAGASGGGSGGMGSVMNAAGCPSDAPRATTTALPCSQSEAPYGTSCSYAAATSGCTEAFECECTSASPGVECFWHPLGETCGQAGSGGSGGSGGAGGAGGSGGGANPCPDTPPTDGTPCTEAEAAFCTYHDCAGAGETNARCQAPVLSMWLVETKPCEPVDCGGGMGMTMTCEQGQICMESRGGGLSITCIDDPCGEGPQGCDCPGVCATCTSFSGNTMVCNDCPAGEECL